VLDKEEGMYYWLTEDGLIIEECLFEDGKKVN
jgi:hypothetical protein